LTASGLSSLGPSLKHAFDLLNINRMQTGIDTYGQVRTENKISLIPCPVVEMVIRNI